nr:c-type cytochrome biogenensis protein [Cavernulicola chilensis]
MNFITQLSKIVITYLTKINFAIILLLVIAVSSLLGTIIEQDQSIEFYKANYNQIILFNISIWRIIQLLGIDHVYKTLWFILLIILLIISLTLCSLKTQFPALRLAKIVKFRAKSYQYGNMARNIYQIELQMSTLIYRLSKQRYQTIQQGYSSYSYQGIIGKISPIIVHISLVIILCGAILGSLTSFVAQEMVPKGEIAHVQNIIDSGILSNISQKFSLRINDFSIAYYENGEVSQFYTNLSLLNNYSEKLSNRIISVNHPLKYRGTTIYQTDWDLSAIRVTFNGHDTYEFPLNKVKTRESTIWVASLPTSPEENLSIVIPSTINSYYIYDKEGKLVQTAKPQELISIRNKYFKILEYIPSTGLQVKADPGIPLVYFGFLLLMISLITTYLSYNQVWSNQTYFTLNLSGENNRAKLQSQTQFNQMTETEIL